MRAIRLFCAVWFAALLAACAAFGPFHVTDGNDGVDCNPATALTEPRCADRSPEISSQPAGSRGYALHFVEFDDQGWLFPDRPGMGLAHRQIDRAIEDLARKQKAGPLSVLVYVHGWRHGAAHDDRDVQRFRQMLSDAALLDAKRSVVGIYVGWRGSSIDRSNPLVYLTLWERKNAALHVSEGSARELFARLRALREAANTPAPEVAASRAKRTDFMRHPPVRTVVMGHSLGAWVVFSALSPGVIEALAAPLGDGGDAATDAWRSARLRLAADLILLINPAFEASRYQPLHAFAASHRLPRYEPPLLVTVTSDADSVTERLFPIARLVNTAFQRPFTSDLQARASVRTPGFVDDFVTHRLDHSDAAGAACPAWQSAPDIRNTSDAYVPAAESEPERQQRMKANAEAERARHQQWNDFLNSHHDTLPNEWSWGYCGAAAIRHLQGRPMVPVWNVRTDGILVQNHSDIMSEPLHAFFRQLYLDLSR